MSDDERLLVCGPESNFPDDLIGECPCGRIIVYRPHSADVPVKLCMVCAFKHMREAKEPVTMMVTDKVKQEVREFLNPNAN